MSQGDQAGSGGDWRVQLREMRTWRALCAASPDADATARLTDRDLRAAAQNPDHSDAGRAAAEAELRARRLSLDPWRLRVPGFITREDLEKKGARLFFGAGQTVRAWSGWAIFIALIVLSVCIAWIMQKVPGHAVEGGVIFDPLVVAAGTPKLEEVVLGVVIQGAMIVFPLAIIVWFIASALRRKPARILLLRKFNERHVSEPLERMLSQELRPYGHVASLSDKHIRRDTFGWLSTALLSLSNPLALIWFVISTPFRFVWRLFDRSTMGPAVVLNARDYRNLAKRLRDRIGLNLQVALTSKEAFLVRTSDAWWKMVVRLFMDSSDAIVVDLSQVTAGTAWELDVIREEQTQARCVFVSIWGKAEEAQAALTARGFDNPCFHYAPDGEMQRRPQFRAAMLAAMRA